MTDPLQRRLTRMLGDPHLAEDVRQEARLRAWRTRPERADAFERRSATNLAIDALRSRARRPEEPLADHHHAEADDGAADAREALRLLTAHQRLVLLLRFEVGLSLRELGELLDVGEDAARKRVARARKAFGAALHAVRAEDDRPTVLVLMGRDDPAPYARWLEGAGARVRFQGPDRPGLDLAGADALVLSGSTTDVHPRTYRAATGEHVVDPDLPRDLTDLRALELALAGDLPVVGVCRGAQLLTVLHGGDLLQHVPAHLGDRPHAVRTRAGSTARRVLGDAPEVISDHHQAVGRLGRGLRVTAVALDGLPEAVEVPDRRLALGTQWHPERGGGDRLAEAIVDAAHVHGTAGV